ncbi:MAG: menaquinone biosynthesis protein [Acidobacteriota bacterium]|nr:menaquinone biosynthesis protein [Acidobacteriota bacterium]
MGLYTSNRLRVAAIDFLNPAPLMWDFEHPPRNAELAARYDIHYTQPALCADDLLSGRADLGLIPIASLTPSLAIVPGCTIASLDCVRSIQLIVKQNVNQNRIHHLKRGQVAADVGSPAASDNTLSRVRTIAADTASRSSLAYAQILFRKFIGTDPAFIPAPADPIAMLAHADAALLIGDPALLALEARAAIEAAAGPCLWLDLAHEWHTRTGLPWVAAVWAVCPEALTPNTVAAEQLTADLQHSCDRGLANIDSLVAAWTPRIAIPPATIRHYLTQNIHYTLSPDCIAAIELFRSYAAEADILPPLPALRFL